MTPRMGRGYAGSLLLVFFAACGLFAGCQSVPPAPADRYYRLADVPAKDVAVEQWTATGSVEIRELRADGPYLERAILFSEGPGTHIESYNYHHWIYPPPYLIQQHMVRRFRESHLAPTIVADDRGPKPRFVVSGRIVRFEQVIGPGGALADVELELEVADSEQGLPLLRKTYRATEPAADSSMEAFVQSMGRALERIYAQFSKDLMAAPRGAGTLGGPGSRVLTCSLQA